MVHPKRAEFLEIFKKAERKYGSVEKRLAGEGWEHDWQTLVATIMSAQSRDETTIPIAEELFRKYPSLEKLAAARFEDVLFVLKSMNYNRTKAKNIVAAARYLLDNHGGRVPDDMDLLLEVPGVGRKTANLVITEVHEKEGITVDTHVHRICNVLGLVNTKTPTQTEEEMKKVAPRKYWARINRLFVLWGKEVPGKDAKRFLAKLDEI